MFWETIFWAWIFILKSDTSHLLQHFGRKILTYTKGTQWGGHWLFWLDLVAAMLSIFLSSLQFRKTVCVSRLVVSSAESYTFNLFSPPALSKSSVYILHSQINQRCGKNNFFWYQELQRMFFLNHFSSNRLRPLHPLITKQSTHSFSLNDTYHQRKSHKNLERKTFGWYPKRIWMRWGHRSGEHRDVCGLGCCQAVTNCDSRERVKWFRGECGRTTCFQGLIFSLTLKT